MPYVVEEAVTVLMETRHKCLSDNIKQVGLLPRTLVHINKCFPVCLIINASRTQHEFRSAQSTSDKQRKYTPGCGIH